MDAIDRRIVAELELDGRLSNVELADRVGLTPAPCLRRVKRLEDDPGYDSRNWVMAMERSQIWGEEIPIGKFFYNPETPPLHAMEPVLDEGGPLALRDPRIAPEVVREFIGELM